MSASGGSAGRLTAQEVRELLDRSEDALYRYRTAEPRGFDFVSDGITAIVGYTPQAHYDDPDLAQRIVHPEDARLVAAAITGDLERSRLTLRWVHRDGGVVWTEHRLRLERDATGAVLAIEGSVRLLDHGPGGAEHELVAGDLRLDLVAARVVVDGTAVRLTPSEHRLLSLLATRAGTVGRPELVRHLWGSDFTANERVLDAHVSNLRRKLRSGGATADPIETVKGEGYRLRR